MWAIRIAILADIYTYACTALAQANLLPTLHVHFNGYKIIS